MGDKFLNNAATWMGVRKNFSFARWGALYFRLVSLVAGIIFLFTLLLVRFFYLQILDHPRWLNQANKQHHVVVSQNFHRGSFFVERQGKFTDKKILKIVFDLLKFHLNVSPKKIPENLKEEILVVLSDLLHWDEKQVGWASQQIHKSSYNRRLGAWLSYEQKELVLNWWQSFSKKHGLANNVLFFEQDFQRSYPYGPFLGHLLHTVQERRDEKTAQAIPTGGLEMLYDPWLQGKAGKREFMRAPLYRLESFCGLHEKAADGANVLLTIDPFIQGLLEHELKAEVTHTGSKCGWAVILDPQNGEILAMAQYPFFHPEHYTEYFNDPEKIENTRLKIVTDPYEPGSVMKPFTLAVALLANLQSEKQFKKPLFDFQEKTLVTPTYFPGRVRPLRDVSSHSYVNMNMAMQKSSNVYFAKMADKVVQTFGPVWYRDVLQKKFHFGCHLGVSLPGESPGVLPRVGKKHPNGTLEWSLSTPCSIAMGHNILVNTLQIARAFASLINGGYEVTPTFVKDIFYTDDSKRRSIYKHNPQVMKILPAEVANTVKGALRFTTVPGGSAAKGSIYGYTQGGKTGTSEKIIDGHYSKTHHISTFIGFAPFERPRFLMAVVMDSPPFQHLPGFGSFKWGGNCGAPLFRRVGGSVLRYLGEPPDNPTDYPVRDPRSDLKQVRFYEEINQMQQQYNEWNHR